MKTWLTLVLTFCISAACIAQEKTVKAVNSVVDLVTLNATYQDTVYIAEGFNTTEDGSAGIWRYYSTDTTATNTSNCVKPISYPGRWKLLISGSGGGGTFNSTNYIPYSTGAAWGNSPFYRVSTNRIGANSGSATNLFIYIDDSFGENMGIGLQALESIDPALFPSFNTVYGKNAGQRITGGSWNTLMGFRVGWTITEGDNNTFIGNTAGVATTTGSENVAIGSTALYGNRTGTQNAVVGTGAGIFIGLNGVSSPSYNTVVGDNAGNHYYGSVTDGGITNGVGNTLIGGYATTTTDMTNTIVVGYRAVATNSASVMIGSSLQTIFTAPNKIHVADNYTAIGYSAARIATAASGDYTAVGSGALYSLTSGNGNTAVGMFAGYSASTNSNSTYVGKDAGVLHTGYSGTYIGKGAGANETFTLGSTLVGYYAGGYNVTGQGNVAMGYEAAATVTNLNSSVVIGDHSYIYSPSLTIHTMTDSVWIGYSSNTNWPATVNNSIVIGSGVNPRGDNMAQIGTNGVTVLYLNGTVGWFRGTGVPAISAPTGSFYTREDGGAGSTFYVREGGSWTAK